MTSSTTSDRRPTSIAEARFKAIVAAPYLASALTAMTFVDTPGTGTVGIDRRFRVYIDPVVLDRWTAGELAGVLQHEVNHVLRDHHQRQVRSGHGEEVFNIAADLEINDDLLRAGIEMPDGALVAAMFDLPDHAVAEWYASRLADRPAEVDHPSCGSGAGGVRAEHELADDDPDVPGIGPAHADRIRDTVARQVAANPGSAPGGLVRWAQARLTSEVPWAHILRAGIHRALPSGSGHHRHSWTRPRRHNPTAALLPSLRAVPIHVAVIIDSSASMTDEHLDQAVSDIAVLRRSPRIDRVSIVACDTEVVEVLPPRLGGSTELVGGGGTSLGAGLFHVSAIRPSADLVVVFTDGITEWPDVAPPRLAPVVVVIPDDGRSGPSWMTTLTRPTGSSRPNDDEPF